MREVILIIYVVEPNIQNIIISTCSNSFKSHVLFVLLNLGQPGYHLQSQHIVRTHHVLGAREMQAADGHIPSAQVQEDRRTD